MTEYGYWEHDHSEVSEEELQERFNSSLDADESPIMILGQEFDRSHIYRELDPQGYDMYIYQLYDDLVKSGEILTDDELEEYIDESVVSWCDDVVLPELPDEIQDQIDNDSEQYHWAIGELHSIGILEYTDKDTIEIHPNYSLEYVVAYVLDELANE